MNNNPTQTPRDLYQEATDKIIKALEEGNTPWQRPWENVNVGPLRNGATGNSYHGINTVMLYCASLERGFTDPRWLSFKQCQDKGYKIKKGAKSERIYFYKPLLVDDRDQRTGDVIIDQQTGKPRQKQIPFLQASPVFNAQEIEGIPAIEPGDVQYSPIQAGEMIKGQSPVEIRHGGNSAHYNPRADIIAMPEMSQFKSPEGYYATLGHEIIHSTGHASRCNREFGKRFGDDAYAFEELVAEMGSVQLALETGLPSQIEHHASYVDHWLKVLKSDKKALFSASAHASRAVDFLMGRQATLESQVTKEVAEPVSVAAKPQPPEFPAAPKLPVVEGMQPLSAFATSSVTMMAKLKERRAKQQSQPSSKGPSLGA